MNTESIRDKVDLLSIVGQYVHLEKRGNSFWGRCPFHREDTASFHVLTNNRVWKCFGCGATGSAFDFLMRLEGLSFMAAVRRVAELSGIQVEPEGKPLSPAEIREDRRHREEARSMMEEAEYWRRVERPPRLWLYDSPAPPQQILAAYQRACTEDPGLRSWVRGEILQDKKLAWVVIELITKRQDREIGESIAW